MGRTGEGGMFVEVRVEEMVDSGSCAEAKERGAGLKVGNAGVKTEDVMMESRRSMKEVGRDAGRAAEGIRLVLEVVEVQCRSLVQNHVHFYIRENAL